MFLQYFEKNAPGLIPAQAAYGDHAAPSDIERVNQDKNLIAAMNFFAAADRFAEMATALDRKEDASWASELAERIRCAILDTYYDAEHRFLGKLR